MTTTGGSTLHSLRVDRTESGYARFVHSIHESGMQSFSAQRARHRRVYKGVYYLYIYARHSSTVPCAPPRSPPPIGHSSWSSWGRDSSHTCSYDAGVHTATRTHRIPHTPRWIFLLLSLSLLRCGQREQERKERKRVRLVRLGMLKVSQQREKRGGHTEKRPPAWRWIRGSASSP